MPRPRLIALLALATAASWVPAIRAAERRIELVPLLGVRNGMTVDTNDPGVTPADADPSLAFGMGLDVYVRPDAWFQGFIERQTLAFDASGVGEFDVDIDYFQFGGGYEPKPGPFSPFVSAGIGITHYGADSGDVDNAFGFSGSIGAGFKAAMGKRVSFKLEVLAYGTLEDASLSVACGPGCFVHFSSVGWFQVAARAGLAIKL